MHTCWSFIVQMFLSVYYVYLLDIYCTHVLECLLCIPVTFIVQMFLIFICIPVAHLLYRCSWLFNMHTCWSFIVQMFLSVYYVYLLDIYCTHVLECSLCIPVGHLLYTCSWVFTMYTCWSFNIQMFLIVYYVHLLVIYYTYVVAFLLCISVGHLVYTCSWLFTMHTCWSFIIHMFLIV